MIFDSRALTMMENSELRRRLQEAQAEIERLRALLEDGREIVADYLPAYDVWLDAVDAALAGKQP
jgi:hypothetical protein